jgi:uncharacterized membrane protein
MEQRLLEFEGLLNRELSSAPKSVSVTMQPRPAPAPLHQQTAPVQTPPALAPVESVITAPPREAKKDTSDFEERMGQKWLLAIGILTMVFGVGYFLKYSFDQGWVGPAGRVTMAYVWGIAFLIAGDWFRKKDLEKFGLPLIGGGIAVLYFSTFAAFQIYQIFGQTLSFGLMVLITMLACVLAIRYDTKWLAVLGLVGGFLTPIMLSTGHDNQIALMTYMTILNLGLLGVAFYKKWDILNTLGFVFTYLLYSAWYGQHYEATKFWPAILFLNGFYLIYSFIPFIYEIRKGDGTLSREIALVGLNAFFAFGYCYVMIKDLYGVSWVSIITLLYAAVSLSLASYVFKKGKQSMNVFVMMMAMAMTFLIITVPVLFSKHWITIFWSAQAFGLLWMAVKLERRSLIAGAYALLLFSVGKFLFYDYDVVFHFGWFHSTGGYTQLIAERYATTLLVLIALYLTRILTKQASLDVLKLKMRDTSFWVIVFGAVLFITLTAEVSAFFRDYLPQARFAAISVLWTIFSAVLMFMGFRKNDAMLRKTSFALFLVVILKVFLFDMANISTPYRIISFIFLGLILMGTSYLYYRKKSSIETSASGAERKDSL